MAREELKSFRIKKHFTQEDMSKILGISLSHYKGIECGSQDPSFKLLCRFGFMFQDQYDDIWKLFGRS